MYIYIYMCVGWVVGCCKTETLCSCKTLCFCKNKTSCFCMKKGRKGGLGVGWGLAQSHSGPLAHWARAHSCLGSLAQWARARAHWT